MKGLLINCITITVVLAGRWRRADNDDGFSLTPRANSSTSCKTRNGLDGICVSEAVCTEDHVIPTYGIIDDNDLRAGNCPGLLDWCCTQEVGNNQTNLSLTMNQGCIVPKGNECPYCVALYRRGGNPNTRTRSGLYCGGTLLGNNVVLTSAGCAIATKMENIWAQIPGTSPNRNYTIKSFMKHPRYSSGTRENDLALLILNENVQDGTQSLTGACLDFRTPLEGQCISAGFDNEDKVVLTNLTVKTGRCTNRGAISDAACGQTNDSCNVSYGSPVLCRYDGIRELIVVGISRQMCRNSTIDLGALTSSASWLGEELTKNGLPGHNYTLTVI